MIWSKLKREVKKQLSDSVKTEVDFFMTEYAGWSTGRAWITINGKEVVSFSTAESDNKYRSPWNELTKGKGWTIHPKVQDDQRTPGLLVEKGEFSRGDFTDCCYQFLDYNILEAQESAHPIIRMLAALDKRTGKRKLTELSEKEVNPMVRHFLHYRLQKEG
jgi:hypothetical protein